MALLLFAVRGTFYYLLFEAAIQSGIDRIPSRYQWQPFVGINSTPFWELSEISRNDELCFVVESAPAGHFQGIQKVLVPPGCSQKILCSVRLKANDTCAWTPNKFSMSLIWASPGKSRQVGGDGKSWFTGCWELHLGNGQLGLGTLA